MRFIKILFTIVVSQTWSSDNRWPTLTQTMRENQVREVVFARLDRRYDNTNQDSWINMPSMSELIKDPRFWISTTVGSAIISLIPGPQQPFVNLNCWITTICGVVSIIRLADQYTPPAYLITVPIPKQDQAWTELSEEISVSRICCELPPEIANQGVRAMVMNDELKIMIETNSGMDATTIPVLDRLGKHSNIHQPHIHTISPILTRLARSNSSRDSIDIIRAIDAIDRIIPARDRLDQSNPSMDTISMIVSILNRVNESLPSSLVSQFRSREYSNRL